MRDRQFLRTSVDGNAALARELLRRCGISGEVAEDALARVQKAALRDGGKLGVFRG